MSWGPTDPVSPNRQLRPYRLQRAPRRIHDEGKRIARNQSDCRASVAPVPRIQDPRWGSSSRGIDIAAHGHDATYIQAIFSSGRTSRRDARPRNMPSCHGRAYREMANGFAESIRVVAFCHSREADTGISSRPISSTGTSGFET